MAHSLSVEETSARRTVRPSFASEDSPKTHESAWKRERSRKAFGRYSEAIKVERAPTSSLGRMEFKKSVTLSDSLEVDSLLSLQNGDRLDGHLGVIRPRTSAAT
eukprot:937231-Amorphochlora_amoeboformis.AAC.1